MLPLMLSVVITAILVVRLYERVTPRQIGRLAFLLVTVGTAWLAIVVKNEWRTLPVILGLIAVGLGQGALMTLLFGVLVANSPSELAGDVGSLRGVTQNLAAAVGTSVVGALLVGLLSFVIMSHLTDNPVITAELKDEVNLTNMNFFSDNQVTQRLANTPTLCSSTKRCASTQTRGPGHSRSASSRCPAWLSWRSSPAVGFRITCQLRRRQRMDWLHESAE
jgi:hypothetical protein